METATQTNKHNRELTPSEIKIAIAQIDDRMIRVAKAQTELMDTDDYGEDDLGKDHRASLREKYDIPVGVHLFGNADSALSNKEVSIVNRHINAFVRGKMTKNQFGDLYFFFEEIAECDYGWVLIEKPMFNYRGKNGWTGTRKEDHVDLIVVELQSIATRAKTKAGKLPHLSGDWGDR